MSTRDRIKFARLMEQREMDQAIDTSILWWDELNVLNDLGGMTPRRPEPGDVVHVTLGGQSHQGKVMHLYPDSRTVMLSTWKWGIIKASIDDIVA
jgi:hypothetical protein